MIPDQLKNRLVYQDNSYVPQGWEHLVTTLNDDIATIDPDYKIVQVKEKFGELRYYVRLSLNLDDDTHNHAFDLIDQATQRSRSICDICGEHGEVMWVNNDHVATRCPKHTKTQC